jgi:hypothetical protein
VDEHGIEVEQRREPIALCRCGKSRLRPFCDGTHKLVGFRAPGAPDLAGIERFCDLDGIRLEISEQGAAIVRPASQQVRGPAVR